MSEQLHPTGHDEVTYGCDESIAGNCSCGEHSYEHICELDEFHDGRHYCCCGRNWQ